ncbi:MAG: tyrosine-type recombinase/integrase, partial [Burkholderiales bacterium]
VFTFPAPIRWILNQHPLDVISAGTKVFPSIAAKQGHTNDIKKAFMRMVAAAGLDPKQVSPHTLRHTAIARRYTHLVQAGVDLPTVKRISGHKTMAMVERYRLKGDLLEQFVAGCMTRLH